MRTEFSLLRQATLKLVAFDFFSVPSSGATDEQGQNLNGFSGHQPSKAEGVTGNFLGPSRPGTQRGRE